MCNLKKTVNFQNFFKMDKYLVTKGSWSKLPAASKTIFPAIAVHANAKGVAFPGQETIASLCGCTPKTVREGLDGLKKFSGIRINPYFTNRGKRSYRFKLKSAPDLEGRSIRIYRSFFDAGNWSQLPSVAHAVYLVLLAYSSFDINTYNALLTDSEEEEPSKFFDEDGFKNRLFDIAEPELEALEELAGISKRSVYTALDALEKNFFIQRADEYFKIFLKPHNIANPED